MRYITRSEPQLSRSSPRGTTGFAVHLTVEFMYTLYLLQVSGESYHRPLRSLLLLCLCDVFRALINSPVCLILRECSGPRSV